MFNFHLFGISIQISRSSNPTLPEIKRTVLRPFDMRISKIVGLNIYIRAADYKF